MTPNELLEQVNNKNDEALVQLAKIFSLPLLSNSENKEEKLEKLEVAFRDYLGKR